MKKLIVGWSKRSQRRGACLPGTGRREKSTSAGVLRRYVGATLLRAGKFSRPINRHFHEASTGLHQWYPSFLRRNPPKHLPSPRLRQVRPSHSSTGLRLWSSAKADKRLLEAGCWHTSLLQQRARRRDPLPVARVLLEISPNG